jgi:histone H4
MPISMRAREISAASKKKKLEKAKKEKKKLKKKITKNKPKKGTVIRKRRAPISAADSVLQTSKRLKVLKAKNIRLRKAREEKSSKRVRITEPQVEVVIPLLPPAPSPVAMEQSSPPALRGRSRSPSVERTRSRSPSAERGGRSKKAKSGHGLKRQRRFQKRDNTLGITKGSIRRLARRAGVKRISGLIHNEAREVLKNWLRDVLEKAAVFTEHSRRKTVTVMDVVRALKLSGNRTLYGFGTQ